MKQNLLIVSSNAHDLRGLSDAFYNLEEIELLPTVSDCKHALAALKQGNVHILLLDLLLPDGDGFVVLDALEELPAASRPAVFVMTALTDERLLYALRDRVLFCFAKPMLYELVSLRVQQLTKPEYVAPVRQPSYDALMQWSTHRLLALGVPAHLTGFHFLRDAIRIVAMADATHLVKMSRDVYPAVAEKYRDGEQRITAETVEAAMRSAIEYAWTHGDIRKLHRYFGNTVNEAYGKPGNAEFVMQMAEHARTEAVRYRTR